MNKVYDQHTDITYHRVCVGQYRHALTFVTGVKTRRRILENIEFHQRHIDYLTKRKEQDNGI